jgi:hypothetical protein
VTAAANPRRRIAITRPTFIHITSNPPFSSPRYLLIVHLSGAADRQGDPARRTFVYRFERLNKNERTH